MDNVSRRSTKGKVDEWLHSRKNKKDIVHADSSGIAANAFRSLPTKDVLSNERLLERPPASKELDEERARSQAGVIEESQGRKQVSFLKNQKRNGSDRKQTAESRRGVGDSTTSIGSNAVLDEKIHQMVSQHDDHIVIPLQESSAWRRYRDECKGEVPRALQLEWVEKYLEQLNVRPTPQNVKMFLEKFPLKESRTQAVSRPQMYYDVKTKRVQYRNVDCLAFAPDVSNPQASPPVDKSAASAALSSRRVQRKGDTGVASSRHLHESTFRSTMATTKRESERANRRLTANRVYTATDMKLDLDQEIRHFEQSAGATIHSSSKRQDVLSSMYMDFDTLKNRFVYPYNSVPAKGNQAESPLPGRSDADEDPGVASTVAAMAEVSVEQVTRERRRDGSQSTLGSQSRSSLHSYGLKKTAEPFDPLQWMKRLLKPVKDPGNERRRRIILKELEAPPDLSPANIIEIQSTFLDTFPLEMLWKHDPRTLSAARVFHQDQVLGVRREENEPRGPLQLARELLTSPEIQRVVASFTNFFYWLFLAPALHTVQSNEKKASDRKQKNKLLALRQGSSMRSASSLAMSSDGGRPRGNSTPGDSLFQAKRHLHNMSLQSLASSGTASSAVSLFSDYGVEAEPLGRWQNHLPEYMQVAAAADTPEKGSRSKVLEKSSQSESNLLKGRSSTANASSCSQKSIQAFLEVFDGLRVVMEEYRNHRYGTTMLLPVLFISLRAANEVAFRYMYPNWARTRAGLQVLADMDEFVCALFSPKMYFQSVMHLESSPEAIRVISQQRLAGKNLPHAHISPLFEFLLQDAVHPRVRVLAGGDQKFQNLFGFLTEEAKKKLFNRVLRSIGSRTSTPKALSPMPRPPTNLSKNGYEP